MVVVIVKFFPVISPFADQSQSVGVGCPGFLFGVEAERIFFVFCFDQGLGVGAFPVGGVFGADSGCGNGGSDVFGVVFVFCLGSVGLLGQCLPRTSLFLRCQLCLLPLSTETLYSYNNPSRCPISKKEYTFQIRLLHQLKFPHIFVVLPTTLKMNLHTLLDKLI